MILCHALGFAPAQLITHTDDIVNEIDINSVEEITNKRLGGQPLAYIFNSIEFRGIEFFVNEDVLVPRPETEIAVTEALNFARKSRTIDIIDIGTGSGVIAVSLSIALGKENIGHKIVATDISEKALEAARQNTSKHNVQNNVSLLESDLLEKITEPADLIIANLPYVPSSDCNGLPDPILALNGGKIGTELIDKLVNQIHDRNLINPGGCLILEIGHDQADHITKKISKLYPGTNVSTIKDLAGYNRVIKAILK